VPRPSDPDAGPRARLRATCLALPEATEQETWGDPTWRVRGRIFAMEKRGDGRVSVWLKAPPGAQGVLTAADPSGVRGQQLAQL
jgi:predicted DNA-binding protein (MmcQ/YjbR family)